MRIKVKSVVRCRLYNLPEKRYYGDEWHGVILAVDWSRVEGQHEVKPYLVSRPGPHGQIWLYAYEVMSVENSHWTMVMDAPGNFWDVWRRLSVDTRDTIGYKAVIRMLEYADSLAMIREYKARWSAEHLVAAHTDLENAYMQSEERNG